MCWEPMPKYVYRCKSCELVTEIVHSMQERLKDCSECDTIDSLVRVPSFSFTLGKNVESTSSSGERVKDFIEDSRAELNRELKSLKKKEYNG